uniref:Pre-mRNA-splicing factor SYF2 n=2 Tax=Hippocampus comes TaxID=109280 RepID=A0A3Q2YXX0_HIPCM
MVVSSSATAWWRVIFFILFLFQRTLLKTTKHVWRIHTLVKIYLYNQTFRKYCATSVPQRSVLPLRSEVMASASEENTTPTEGELTETFASSKREDRLRKFRELHFKRNEARKLNHQEVVEEDKRLKLPSNWEAKKARLEWELNEDEKKKECAARGEDYHRVKLLDITADDAARWERKKKKKNPDTGFAGYAEAQFRQYQRLTKQIRPDMQNYEKQREECGEDFHPTSNSLIHGTHVPSQEGIDRMVEDVEKQIEKRAKYSRRRAYNDDADIDYINERNAKFNKKAERFYGKYTAEIKQNLERGTAV